MGIAMIQMTEKHSENHTIENSNQTEEITEVHSKDKTTIFYSFS